MIYRDQRFRNHPKAHKKALKADRKLRTITGRLVRELERNLKKKGITVYERKISLFYRILAQRKNDKNKVRSLHEPETTCISKGKEYKKNEFGNKVSVARTTGGLIIGMLSFRKEHDSRTISGTLDQIRLNTGRLPSLIACDRGYRGIRECQGVKILIPGNPKKSDTYERKRRKRLLFCKRAAIEPTIGHLKSDYRMKRNFLKGVMGDAVNAMLSAAAFNFKRAMNALFCLFFQMICSVREIDVRSL